MFSRRSLKEDMTASRSEPEIEDAMDEMETIQYELMPFVNKDEENYE